MLVVGNERIRGLQNLRRAAEIFFQTDHGDVWEIAFKPQNVLNLRRRASRKSIDPDRRRAQVGMNLRQGGDDLILGRLVSWYSSTECNETVDPTPLAGRPAPCNKIATCTSRSSKSTALASMSRF